MCPVEGNFLISVEACDEGAHLVSCAFEALFSDLEIAATRLDLVSHAVDELAQVFKVRPFQEGFILDEVLDLVPVVRLERLVLQLLQVTFVELYVFLILEVLRFEEALGLTPFERVTQLEVAHALLLDAFDPEAA